MVESKAYEGQEDECTYRGALAGCHDINCPVHKDDKAHSFLMAKKTEEAIRKDERARIAKKVERFLNDWDAYPNATHEDLPGYIADDLF